MIASHNPHTDPIAQLEDEDLFRPRSPAMIQMEEEALAQRVKESEALHVYQDFIDSMSECNMAGDFEAWCALHALPHTVHLDDVDKVLHDHVDTQKFFTMMTDLVEKHGINQISRVGDSAQRIGIDEIEGYHTCYLLKDGVEVLDSVDGRMRIQKRRGRWYLVEITNNLKNQKYPYMKPQVSDGLQTAHVIKNRMRD